MLIYSSALSQQFYLRGEIRDEAGNPLQNVNIMLHATGYVYHTGAYGSFGILTNRNTDTLSVWLEGYQKQKLVVSPENFIMVRMKLTAASITSVKTGKLASLTKGLSREVQKKWFTGDETYASILENSFISANKNSTTSVSLNTDRASYSNIRRFINTNTFVPPDAVRIEEMLNYFNDGYVQPDPGNLFKTRSVLTSCPWNPENQLLFVNINSKRLDLEKLPPSNFVFLIDISGSMDLPNRLPLLQSAFRMLVNNLRAKDTVSIVVYGGMVGLKLNGISGGEKGKILKAIDELTPGGFTPGESGIKIAYSIAQSHYIAGGNNRVILATDGDFNVGLKKEEELDELITQRRNSGIYLTCLGVGMGNYKDSKIQTLARKGNGNFAYLDGVPEAEKVLMTEFTQTLYAVADDVYLDINLNKDYVKEYRLIGYDNKLGPITDSSSQIEGGEVGSGQSMMAVFEIIPTAYNVDAVKRNFTPGNIAELAIHYHLPEASLEKQYSSSIPMFYSDFNSIEKCFQFSTAVVMFGSMLRSSPYTKNIGWNDVLKLAAESSNDESTFQKEFVNIVQLAKTMYSKKNKKKKDLMSLF